MPTPDPYKQQDLDRLQIFVTLIPVVGFLPALWALYRQQSSPAVQNVSRLVVTLTLGWLLGYGLLGAGAQLSSESTVSTLSLLILSSLLTSGYFLVNLWLMVRLWQRKSLRLPGISRLSDRLD
ncbi:MAG: hypothetical protein ACKO7W_20785 [Elainella sp.]